jgi:hypothetical protein
MEAVALAVVVPVMVLEAGATDPRFAVKPRKVLDRLRLQTATSPPNVLLVA